MDTGTLLSLSKSATADWLTISEVTLLVAGLLVVVGVIGESAKTEKWKAWEGTFEMLVIIGVAGELLADGGVFLFSRHQQTIAEIELVDLEIKAGDAKKSADEAADATKRAVESARSAEALARGARQEADSFEKDIALAKKEAANAESEVADARNKAAAAEARVVKIEKQNEWRNFTPEQAKSLCSALNRFRGTKMVVNSLSAVTLKARNTQMRLQTL